MGFILETYALLSIDQMERLQMKMGKAYSLLDPTLLNEGKYLSKWKLKLNISQEELKATLRT